MSQVYSPAVNYVDLDPWGDPWPVLQAFMESGRPRVPVLHVVVNDGLVQYAKRGHGWDSGTLATVAQQYGNTAMYRSYLTIVENLMRDAAARGGYRVSWCKAYRASPQLVHAAARLELAV